ncbi:hypothetical protein GIB67_023644 [Kingdonia uniflora]|uniref:Uncharacterized protein n=1 Tax=Kingdonia uniflora TaxID=39325 RepID=A0A7J7L530_9MAGN|nr:hypothetical protein GIB67_023644 [Kingdonia uniflora]
MVSFLVLVPSFDGSQAIEYQVSDSVADTLGGIRFDNEIGQMYSEEVLELASKFIWETFQQGEGGVREDIQEITMVVESHENSVVYTIFNDIHLSAEYVSGYSGDVRIEVIGVIYHEATHVWQWGRGSGSGTPSGLIEGIADYVRLKSG